MNAAPWRGRVVGAALELNQQADTERRTTLASAATPDDPTTPAVDEHQTSVATGTVHSTTPPP